MQVRCGQCGTVFTAEGEGPPATAECPNCSHPVPLPAADESAPQLAGAPAAAGEEAEGGFAELARKSIGRKLHVTCGSCGKHLTVSPRQAGKRGRCPACRARIEIPRFEEADEFDLAYLGALAEFEGAQLDLGSEWEAAEEAEEVEIVTGLSRGQRTVLAIVLVVVVGLAVGLWVGMLVRSRSGRQGPEPPGRAEVGRPKDTPKTPAKAKQTPKAKPPAKKKSAKPPAKKTAKKAPPPPKPAGCVWEAKATSAGVFAAGGYRPAPPGRVYVRVTVAVTAGEKPLSLRTFGDDVVLELAGEKVASLGLAAEAASLFVQAEPRVVRVEPGAKRELTFLFETPQKAGQATLVIAPDTKAPAGYLALKPPDASPVGRYVEAAPRNLKPLLRDPVMAAVQAAGGQQLIVRQRARSLQVQIPSAGVTGSAQSAGEGVYAAALRHEGHLLRCKLRLIEGGKRLVLYLSDAPFHQLTYERQ
jgi:hypothetical protein